MKINERIKILLEENSWTLADLHREISRVFEESAITYLTLLRTIHGKTKLRESTLFQIATALGKTPEDIRKDTEEEEKFTQYSYNKKAYMEIESSPLNFLTARLILLPGAKTETEQDPQEKGDFIKWIYGLQGEISCVVIKDGLEQRQKIKKNETFYFPSTCPHYFENQNTQKAIGLLIQNPKYI
ncbi:MAG TPA: hypothetical protein PLH56_01590 [Candidatus Omnitrophota bacterium]|nr:hypothetical protein [Candidatus Omnitrophota bacterium]